MKKHNIDMIAAWARDWGIRGYDHLDPVIREKHRQRSLRYLREKERRQKEEKEKRRY